MNFEQISSKNNQRIKRVHSLVASSSERAVMGLFVLEGLRLCRDAAQNGVVAAELYFTSSAISKFPDDLALLISKSDRAFCVTDDVFKKMSATDNTQGVCAVYSASTLKTLAEPQSSGRYIACENVADPANLGAISRTAEALGIDGLILLGHCCDRLNPKALRASMGALMRLPVIIMTDAASAVVAMKNRGMRVLASVVNRSATEIGSIEFADGDVVIIGNEANGITAETVSVCSECITIRIKGRAESFNAAAAASIIMWELAK